MGVKRERNDKGENKRENKIQEKRNSPRDTGERAGLGFLEASGEHSRRENLEKK